MKGHLWNIVKTRRPDLLVGKTLETITDEEITTLARQAMPEVSLDQVRSMLWDALNERDKENYLTEVYPSYLIYENSGKYYRLGWSIIDGELQLGSQVTEVEKAWVEARSTQATFEEGLSLTVRIVEALEPSGLAWDVTICEPGLSQNGVFIPDEVLRDQASLFEGVDVNLYELPNGPSHIPELLFDLKKLLVKNKVGWIDQVRHVAGVGLKGILHFLDSASWIGRNIMSAMKDKGPVYGLSWDSMIRANRDLMNGKPILRLAEFRSVDSVDIVSRPAAGGKFNRAVAGMPAQKREESMKNRLLNLISQKRPDLLQGKDVNALSDEQVETLARMAMEAPADKTPGAANAATKEDLDLFRCEMALEKRLAGSDLPQVAKDRVSASFSGRVFQSADLDKAIADEKEYLGKVHVVQVGSPIPASGIAVGIGTFERACMAADRMFGMTKEDVEALTRLTRLDQQPFFEDRRSVQDLGDYNQVPAFRGLREMYAFFTGDPEVSGRFNRQGIPAELRSRMDINSGTFSYVLGNTLGRRLVNLYRAYDFMESLLISVRKSVKDMRQQEAVLVGGFPDLADVDPEAADYREIAGVTDEESTYTVGTKGNILTITRKTIINDDISIIMRLIQGLARAARRTHAKYVWNFFINNSNCSDGTAWFTEGHTNLGATALSHATALVAYKALAAMTEKDSGERLGLLAGSDVKPNLVGPIDIMETIQKIAEEEFYYSSNDLTAKVPNPLRGKVQGKVIPLLTDANDWGLLLPPEIADMVEMGYLNGREEPEMFLADSPQAEQVFVADKIRHKIRHEYAGAVIDYRSGYKAVVA